MRGARPSRPDDGPTSDREPPCSVGYHIQPLSKAKRRASVAHPSGVFPIPGDGGGWTVGAGLAAATLVSEDLASAAAGVLVAGGRIGFLTAALACFAGIVAGDLLLFAAGRLLGRRVLDWGPIRSRVGAGSIERSSAWLDRRGPLVVLLSRFTPGTRLPTCLLAGALRTDAKRFVLWFLLSAALWTPLIVGASAAAGSGLRTAGAAIGGGPGVTMLLGMLAIAGLLRIRALASWKTRRRLYGRWQRLTRWEFWPIWAVYPPVVAYIIWLAARYRSATVVTAANPGIPGGGVAGESKFEILRALEPAGEAVASAVLLPAQISPERRVSAAEYFIQRAGLNFPVVLKPDKGQRGSGVTIVRSARALTDAIRASRRDLILQEFAPGYEFGIFYARRPGLHRGRIISVTEKRFPAVVGDGRRTLEDLILADERAVCLERLHCRVHEERLRDVPYDGEIVRLVEIGSHCRGALFLDAARLLTPAMEDAFDRIARGFRGFFFGRFDVRTPCIDDFRLGRNFKIVELNGVTSEATHVYDPENGLPGAYRVLFAQWRLAFEIGAANVSQGAAPAPLRELVTMVRHAWSGERTAARPASASEWEYGYEDGRRG